MHRRTGFLFLLLILSVTTNAQSNKCNISLSQSPELRGFRLGMTVKDITKAIKRKPYAIKGDIPGRKVLLLMPEDIDPSSGVDKLAFEFLDDKVVSIYVHYRQIPFTNHLEFLNAVSTSMQLPTGAWVLKYNNFLDYGYEMTCDGFIAKLNHKSAWNADISLVDSIAGAEAHKRTEELEKREKKEFKP